MNQPKRRGSFFITGTDTDVGKTVSTTLLMHHFRASGYSVAGYKPVASGAELMRLSDGNTKLLNPDAYMLLKNSSLTLKYEEVNPYFFTEAEAPHILSEKEHRPIDFAIIRHGANALANRVNYLFIEGAGGWFTPLNKEQTFAQWVQIQKIPVIVVVGLKLGCINHALLTFEAISAMNLQIAGWLGNQVDSSVSDFAINNYLSAISTLAPKVPYLGLIPHLDDIDNLNSNLLNQSLENIEVLYNL